MSQPDEVTDQDVLEILRTDFIYDCLTIALVALPVYEYLITLGQEVELVWRRPNRFSVQSILLVSTRTCMIASAVLSVTVPQSTCTGLEVFNWLQGVVDAVGFLQVALFSALRASAICNRNIGLFIVVLSLSLPAVVTNLFSDARSIYIQQMGLCIEESSIPDALVPKLVLVSRIPIIFADVLVLIVTWMKTYKQMLLARRTGVSTPLSTCLARDGTMYFLALVTMNVLQIATFRGHLGAPVNIILPTLPPILINRFMLNLRQVGDTATTTSTGNSNRSDVSTLQFQFSENVMGSMGAPLDHMGLVVSSEHEDITSQRVSEAERGE